jgi:glucose-6-phosphate dehydrogenase assembly protein OpcA
VAPDVTALERLQQEGLEVDPRAIEAEFDRIWRETAGAGADQSSIRVRVLNLVAIATGEDGRRRFDDVMEELAERHPCRAILAATTDDGEPPLSATISAHCWRAAGAQTHVCSEEVELTGAAREGRRLASAALPLLVPDLPVVVWLMDEPAAHGEVAGWLIDAADAVILDSGRHGDPASALALALAWRRDHGVTSHDLAWGRLSAWRALIAQLFDGADGAREIDQLRDIEVRGGAGGWGDALLLAGWLASRLGLALADTSRSEAARAASFYDGTRHVAMRIIDGAGATRVERVRIVTADAEFVVEHHGQSGHMHVRENWDSGSTRRTVEQEPLSEAAVIDRALDGGTSTSVVYEEAARLAIALNAAPTGSPG